MERNNRMEYKSTMGENLAMSCKSFLDNTGLGPKELVRAVRHVMRMLKPYLKEEEEDDEGDGTNTFSASEKKKRPILEESNDIKNSTIAIVSYETTELPLLFEDESASRQSNNSAALDLQELLMARPDEVNNESSYEIPLLIAFVILILVQLIILIILLWICLMYEWMAIKNPSSAGSDRRRNSMERSNKRMSKAECTNPEGAPYNMDATSDATPSTSAEMAARRLLQPTSKKLRAVSSISSSDLGSDSEFEALMKRRPLANEKCENQPYQRGPY